MASRALYHILASRALYHILASRALYHILASRALYHILASRALYHILGHYLSYHIVGCSSICKYRSTEVHHVHSMSHVRRPMRCLFEMATRYMHADVVRLGCICMVLLAILCPAIHGAIDYWVLLMALMGVNG